jgi:hypothetical protein
MNHTMELPAVASSIVCKPVRSVAMQPEPERPPGTGGNHMAWGPIVVTVTDDSSDVHSMQNFICNPEASFK